MSSRELVARGTFEVTIEAAGHRSTEAGVVLGRSSLSKIFHGDLEGASVGEMLSATTPVEGSAGYVAIERVSGVLLGRSGTFVLQHTGVMTRGSPLLAVAVVPDSGTGELAGLSGTMTIVIDEGAHSYELRCNLPAAESTPPGSGRTAASLRGSGPPRTVRTRSGRP